MKKLIACVSATLLLACFAFGQKNEKPKVSVIWSPEPGCHQNNTAEVKDRRPVCSTAQVDTMTFYIINFDGVSYAMTHRPVRDYLVTSVQISNKSETPIHVTPLRSRISRFKSAGDFTNGSKGDQSSALSQDNLRQASYRESTVIGEADGGIRSGLRVEETYEETVSRGRVVSRTTRTEPAAPPSSNPTPSMITNSVLLPREVFDYVMKSQTIGAGQKAAGHVVFKGVEKDEGYVVFYLNAGPIEFVFPTKAKP